ncbi:MAG: hypothetical protein GF333_00755 [Candidatus Omnitrophica bacterium]|nr:hypothetical protein [Candidatus Omnitrophota bacterium]
MNDQKYRTLLIWWLGAVLLPFFAACSSYASSSRVVYIPVHGEINYGMAGFVQRAVKEASSRDADLLLFGIDTFGGRVDASLEIAQLIQSASDIPSCAYVEDSAWSAGALIALACDKIIMRRGSSIGSAAPVSGKGKTLGEKYVSALRAKFQALAEQNGYPPQLAMAMVDKDIEVYRVEVDGVSRYMTTRQIDNVQGAKVTRKELVSPKGKLLNLTAEQAEQFDIASLVVATRADLTKELGLDGVQVKEIFPTWQEQLASFITGAVVSSLLLSLGFLLLMVEFQNPGIGWAGTVGVLCFALFFFGRYVADLAQWADILLFVLGVGLIAIEIFVVPGFGVPGVAGLVCVLVSLYFALTPYVVPREPWDFFTLQKTVLMILGSVCAGVVGGIALLNYLYKIPGLRKFALLTEQERPRYQVPPSAMETMTIGKEGRAYTDLRPVGRVQFGDDVLDAVSAEGFIEKGLRVKVIEISGNRILVKRG